MSRIDNSAQIAKWHMVSNITNAVLNLVLRKIFIDYLGVYYLGISGLFGEILGLLSFAELGFGSALTFLLFKPVAQGDEDRIVVILQFYKRVYRAITLFIVAAGLCLIPFLGTIVKPDASVDNLVVLYLLYLVNSVVSYISAYRATYVYVLQKDYINLQYQSAATLVTTLAQMAAILLLRDYTIYLIITVAMGVLARVVQGVYLGRLYPILRRRTTEKLPAEELAEVKRMIRSLFIQTLGGRLVNQTDSIITSTVLSDGILTVGLMSNYVMIKNTVLNFAWVTTNSVYAGLGNVVASESKEMQLQVFRLYHFLVSCVTGFCFIAMAVLSTPFISLLFGAERTVAEPAIFLFYLNVFFAGQRQVIDHLRNANGAYHIGRFLPLFEAGVNLAVSILLANLIGLPGIYIGTVASALVQFFGKPPRLFHELYGIGPGRYFRESGGYLLFCLVCCGILYFARGFVWGGGSILGFAGMVGLTAAVPLGLFFLIFGRSAYTKELFGLIRNWVDKHRNKGEDKA